MFWKRKEEYKEILHNVETHPCTFKENPLSADIVTVSFEGQLPEFTFTSKWILQGWPDGKPFEKEVFKVITKRYYKYLATGKTN